MTYDDQASDGVDKYQCHEFPETYEVMFVHLNGQMPYREGESSIPEFVLMSTLHHALQEMNSARSGRNTEIMTPLIAAFAILDQLGECYACRDREHDEPSARSAIKKALHHFPPFSGPLSPEQAQALSMLRNGLVHDASFSSQEERGQKRWMIFRHDLELRDVIQLPERTWNGAAEDVCQQTITWFNPDLVLWLATAAVGRLSKALQHDDPNLNLKLPPEVVIARYLLWVRNPANSRQVKAPVDREELRKQIRDWLVEGEVALYNRMYPTS